MKKLLLLFTAAFSLLSCSVRIDGSLSANGSAVINIRMSLEPGVTALFQRLYAAGGQSGASVLDSSSIARSMSNASGVASVSFRNTSRSAIEGQIRISRINDFLASTDGSRFITFEQRGTGGRLTINIDRAKSPAILAMLSEEVVDYLNALMAPIASGETMSKHEYLDLVAVFYNRTISNEIASSRILASIEFPGRITNVRGGTFSGRTANFDIPLLDLLVLETPLDYEVTW